MKSFLYLTIVLIIVVGSVFFWWNIQTSSPQNDKTSQPFVISRGMSATQIANKLEQERFIKSSLAFRFYVQLTGKANKIQAGDYRLPRNLFLTALVGELLKGPVAIWITLPEGLRREEIIIKIVDGLELTGTKRQEFLAEFLRLTANSEGYLFPDTYLLFKNATPSAVVARLKGNFDKKVDEDISDKQTVILASIIERETITDEERPVVAGILLKRLEAGWPLQADATLQYAVAIENCKLKIVNCSWWPNVLSEDKKISSPYNTYTNRGLPPTPIANPGLSSIKAAANPQSSSYWFYLHDSKGKIHYARTSEEHKENISKFLR